MNNDRFIFKAWIPEYNKIVDVHKIGIDAGCAKYVWHSKIYLTSDGKPMLDDWGRDITPHDLIVEKTKMNQTSLLQYTGFCDRNNKPLFEGQIITFDISKPRNGGRHTGVITWGYHNEMACWIIEDLSGAGAWFLNQTAHPNDWMLWAIGKEFIFESVGYHGIKDKIRANGEYLL